LLLLAFVIALPLPPGFLAELALYVAATTAYSLWLKRVFNQPPRHFRKGLRSLSSST
jgi:4-hydroxybenzoate polyprenyltransferase